MVSALTKKMIDFNAVKLEKICREFNLQLVVLFGSQANGRARAHSDVDVAVLLPSRKISVQRELKLVCAFMQLFRRNDVDVVILNHANGLMQFRVASEGKLLYERKPGQFQLFQMTAVKRYHDFRRLQKYREMHLERFIRKSESYAEPKHYN